MSTPIIIGGGPPHVQRMAIEANELNDRLSKLRAFLGTETFASLDDDDKSDLLSQESHMAAYWDVLIRRYEKAIAKHAGEAE